MRQRRHVWDWDPGTMRAGTCKKCGARFVDKERKAKLCPEWGPVTVRVYISPDGSERERVVPPCKPREAKP